MARTGAIGSSPEGGTIREDANTDTPTMRSTVRGARRRHMSTRVAIAPRGAIASLSSKSSPALQTSARASTASPNASAVS